MSKFATPQLDQLETGPWPSFVSDIKQEAAHRAANANTVEYQIPVDCPEDLLGVLELSYNEKETHWKHGGIVGVFGYGGGVIGLICKARCQFIATCLEGVGNILQKYHTENDVLVLGCIHVGAELVCSCPKSLFNVI
ncbi:hypothetical protein SDC9_05701 [bioreactor metagenome]|uniref:Sulfite reductase, dissimilatory-type subunit alpha n=1 Tax=bioreactor metagenome TaxID=1076179 RepID=A0A644SZT1_9ZZZZ